ncbi:hypothetical protein JCM10207_000567 [Rhodosporidiobolus poonsookiae]
MSVPSFAGAPVSKALIASLVVASVTAAVTQQQHRFHLPLVPHLVRDHQFYRFLVHNAIYANSSELFLAVLLLWYSAPTVERMWGTRKFANFVLVATAFSTALTALVLLLGWRLTGGRFNSLPAGPFAPTFALIYQAHRLVPTLYHFKLFHPSLSLTNRFPLYLLALLLLTSQPPASALLSTLGLLSSLAYTSNLLSLASYRLPKRLYAALARLSKPVFGDPSAVRVRRANVVTPEEAMLAALLGTGGGVVIGGAGGGGAGGGVAGIDLAAGLRGQATAVQPRPPTQPRGTNAAAARAPVAEAAVDGEAEQRRSADEVDEADATSPVSPTGGDAPPAAAATDQALSPERALPRIAGANFLQQWRAGLTGGDERPTQEQINELHAIFPHHTRRAVAAALQQNGLSRSRAAEALLLAGDAPS